MSTPPPRRVTRLLSEIEEGRSGAADELLPVVYEELRKLARARMGREGGPRTLQPTALVHEAYVRLVQGEAIAGSAPWANRAHFFAAAAEAMRRILIERARRVRRQRHGDGWRRVSLAGELVVAEEPPPEEMLSLDGALRKLEERDPEMGRVVKLRCFAGFSVEESADCLGLSSRTVKRHWAAARAWLFREMTRTSEEQRP